MLCKSCGKETKPMLIAEGLCPLCYYKAKKEGPAY
jgi:NMD protein affecting ribosome stability and mRNA decay